MSISPLVNLTLQFFLTCECSALILALLTLWKNTDSLLGGSFHLFRLRVVASDFKRADFHTHSLQNVQLKKS